MEYFCPKENCDYKGSRPYILILPEEACVDVNNIASIFCPYCQSVLQPVYTEEVELENEIA